MLEYFSFIHSLILSLPTHDETEIGGLGLWSELLNPSLTKVSASSLP
jgi:hypothetical protein